ncbi:hypothetical protein [Flammeovirga sp. EKP202]|uniref:hypothetical protein n=1 Tax=Flammeovirga sp. EKP202 TaxID=2770592 RepID=UPI00165F424F|nr:hypothetical protein [Flammeovirga sp. EKP202]MBD0405177.1 hypothetical protein [Flammeovirga sp. EKP202]
MTEIEAIKIANNHIERMNQDNPYSDKMNWVLSQSIEYEKGFYFDYKFDLINHEENLAFGGAPGFLILKNNSSVVDLSWGELHELNK